MNRSAEVTAALDFLRVDVRRRTRIMACTGPAGVGKSAFVRHVVESIPDAEIFPGGEVFLDFREYAEADREQAPSDALAACLRALGVPADELPPGLQARTSMFRTRTANEPVLVVLDHVTDPAQVLPFVPSCAGSTLVAVSNSRQSELLVEGAHPLPLTPLDGPASVHVLAELSERDLALDTEGMASLVRECGGLFLALKVAALRLKARPSLSIADLAAAISGERGLKGFAFRGAPEVAPVFDVTYRDLPDDAARLYRLLGCWPLAEFSPEFAAAAVGLEQSEVDSIVDELVEAGVVDRDDDGRLRLHPLIRRHALEAAEAQETAENRAKALYRMTQFLLRRCVAADLAVLGAGRYRVTEQAPLLDGEELFPDKASALDWLETERPNLMAAMEVALELGRYRAVWQLAEAASALYLSSRYLVDWVDSTEFGVKAAKLDGNARAEARLRSFATRPLVDLGRYHGVLDELADSLTLAQESGDRRLEASIWEMTGRARDVLAPETAAEAYQRAIDIFTSEEDWRGVAFVRYFLGSSQLAISPELSLTTLLDGLPAVREHGPGRMEGRALISIGRALAKLDRKAEAAATFREAVEVLADFRYFQAQAWEGLAEITEDAAELRESLSQALAIHEAMSSPRTVELRERLEGLEE